MTREEAKQWIKDLISTMKLETSGSFPDAPYKDEVYEALEMAIKALEQEPCDAISRQAAIDAMYALCDTGETLKENPWRDNPYIDAIIDALDNLPSVTPQQKIGRWKRISMDKYSEHAKYWYRCDRCGKDNLGNTDYCPNCGQPKMESKEP